MNAHAQRRLKQIQAELDELAELSLNSLVTRADRNRIAQECRALVDERENLIGGSHYLNNAQEFETQDRISVTAVLRELNAHRTINQG